MYIVQYYSTIVHEGSLEITETVPLRYIGACGRVAVIEGGISPLPAFTETSWAFRADLASQVKYCLKCRLYFSNMCFKEAKVCPTVGLIQLWKRRTIIGLCSTSVLYSNLYS